ncbi:mitochondrial escape protein 2 [Entophlyctis luteolus]|nr:mitochondrial escape protein 2 [Entophlyctis luteolus]
MSPRLSLALLRLRWHSRENPRLFSSIAVRRAPSELHSPTVASKSASTLGNSSSEFVTVWIGGVLPIPKSRFSQERLLLKKDAFLKKHLHPTLDLFKSPFTLVNTTPSLKEGGVLARFSYDGDIHEAANSVAIVASEIAQSAKNSEKKVVSKIVVHLVEGSPWIEDIQSSVPSNKIQLDFRDQELSVEKLYHEFRKYGEIKNISVERNPKFESRKFGYINYLQRESAVAAKICANGKHLGQTKLEILYAPSFSPNSTINFVREHQKLMLPLFLIVVVILAFLIVDPVRVFFVTNNVTNRFSLKNIIGVTSPDFGVLVEQGVMNLIAGAFRFAKLLSDKDDERSQAKALLARVRKEYQENLDTFRRETRRDEHEAKISQFLKQSPESIMLVQGPKGARPDDLIEKCLENEPVIRISLDSIINEPDHIFVHDIAHQVGFFPVFDVMMSNSGAAGVLDTAVSAITGHKTSLSLVSDADSHLRKIFEIVTVALNRIVNSEVQRRQTYSERVRNMFIRRMEHDVLAPVRILNELGDRHARIMSVLQAKQFAIPDIQYPVVVIDGFLNKERARQSHVYKHLVEWANELVQARVARVIFASENMSASTQLSRGSAVNLTVETVSVVDSSFPAAMRFVWGRLGLGFSTNYQDISHAPPELVYGVNEIGGRLADLEVWVQKIRAGLHLGTGLKGIFGMSRRAVAEDQAKVCDGLETGKLAELAKSALNDMVVRIETEIRKVGLTDDVNSSAAESDDFGIGVRKEWTAVQAWKVVELLAKYKEVSFDDLRFHPLFNGDEAPILSMERAGLVAIDLREGRPFTVKVGRPIFRSAFSRLLADKKFAAAMRLKTVKVLMKDEHEKLAALENELSVITGSPSIDLMNMWASASLRRRVNFLGKCIGEVHSKLAALDGEERRLKKLLVLAE